MRSLTIRKKFTLMPAMTTSTAVMISSVCAGLVGRRTGCQSRMSAGLFSGEMGCRSYSSTLGVYDLSRGGLGRRGGGVLGERMSERKMLGLRLGGDRNRMMGGVMGFSSRSGREGKDDSAPTPTTPKKKKTTPLILQKLKTLTPHENIYTIPNILTLTRLIAAPICGYLVLHDQHFWAVTLFAYAGITDLVDGWIARKWNLQTVVGTVIDPMADKTLMTVLTVCLAVQGGLPVWLAAIILTRDILLALTAIYYRWISLPPPKTFSRYWDFSLPSAEVHPTTISKYNTALQLGLIGATTALPLVSWDSGAFMMGFQYLVATTTIWSGASYIYTKDAVKILNQEGSKSKKEGNGKGIVGGKEERKKEEGK